MSEEVRIQSSTTGVMLAGTLLAPRDASAAALLLPGSGPQDRDETIGGQTPLQALASRLAERGIASLRCDDRGVGGSDGDYLAIDGEILLGDARCQLEWLRKRLPGLPVGLVGHSQGGLFSLRLARLAPVDAVVLLAAAIRPGMQSMMSMRMLMADDSGLQGDARINYLEHSKALFEAIALIDDLAEREAAVRRLVEDSIAGARDEDFHPDFATAMEYVDFAVRDAMEWEVRELLRSDPGEDLTHVAPPILALWGSLDRHLDPEAERAAFEAAAPAGSRSEILTGYNHLFQHSETGAIEDYASDGPPMQDPVADLVRSSFTSD